MSHRAWRVSMVVTCALALALALGIGWGLERAQAGPLVSIITVTSAADGAANAANCPGTSCRLRDALAAAGSGDVILFSLPVNSVITLTNGELVVNQSLTILGATAVNLAVSGNNASRVFSVTAPLTVISLTVENGSTSGNGGGLFTNGGLTLIQVAFLSNTATLSGGGLFAAGTAVLTDATFISNTAATYFGGGAYLGGNATVSDGRFERNRAPDASDPYNNGYGGGLYVNGALALTDTQFFSNSAGVYGGGLFAGSNAALANATFVGNTAGYELGGGAAIRGDGFVSGGRFERNSAKAAGGLYTYVNSTLTLTGTQFLSNTAVVFGGGLTAVSSAVLTNTTFSGNTAGGTGGGMSAAGTFGSSAVLANVTFTANSSGGFGGGLSAGSAVLSNVTFSNNTASNGGGGLHAGSAVLNSVTFISNTDATQGGGLDFLGDAALNGVTLSGNTCTASGCASGGLFAGGPLTLTQSVTTGDDALIDDNWTNNGAFVQTAGATTFVSQGSAQSITGGGTTSFHHVQISSTDGISLFAPINVSGHFTDTGVFTPAGGSVTFNGTDAQRIVGSAPTTFGDVAIANTGAGVSLGQDITVTDRLTLTSDLNTAGSTLFLTASATSAGNGDVWGRTVRAHPFSPGTTYAFGSPFVSLTFSGGTPPSQLTVVLTPTLPVNADNTVRRVYQIEPVGGSGYTARLRLHYRDSELNGNQEGALQLWRYPVGGPWTAYAATSFDATDNWVENNAVSTLSLWTLSQRAPTWQLYLPLIRR